jgi:carboxylesterase
MTPGRIISSAEPFLFQGGPTGCLVVHGFTGAPKEVRPLGKYLAEQGHTVLGIRLTGHATHPRDMLRARWEDWLTDVEGGWHMLRQVCEQVFVIGLSMGGMLSLLHASRFPVDGIVAMSTLHNLQDDWRLPYAEALSRVQPTVAKGPPDWHDPEVANYHVAYPTYPTRAVGQLRDLLAAMRQALPQVTAPLLLINSKNDGSVLPEDRHAEQILEAVGSQEKDYVLIEGSGHVITEDAQREKVFKLVEEFIRRHEANGQGHTSTEAKEGSVI